MFFAQQVAFLVRILVRKCKKRKKVEKKKNIMFYMKNCKKEQFCFKNKRFFEKKHPEPRDTRIFWDFRFCGSVVVFLSSKVISCVV